LVAAGALVQRCGAGAVDWERAHPPETIVPKQFDDAAEDEALTALKQS
jgi:hypothetical protein